MMSVFAGGKVLPPGETGVTRLIDTGTVAGTPSSGRTLPAPLLCGADVVTVTVPVFAPGGSPVTSALTTRRIFPSLGTLPDDGDTVRYGLSTAAVKVPLVAATLTVTGTSTCPVLPNGTTASVPRDVDGGVSCTTIDTGLESGPTAPPHERA